MGVWVKAMIEKFQNSGCVLTLVYNKLKENNGDVEWLEDGITIRIRKSSLLFDNVV